MPVSCTESVLTGSDGALYVTPAATAFCLKDFSDFPAGAWIQVQANDYRIGDPIQFTLEGSATLDSALAINTTYYIVAVDPLTNKIQVANIKGGAAVVLAGNGGVNGPTPGTPAVYGVVGTITPPTLPTTVGGYGTGPFTGISGVTLTGVGVGATFNVTVTTNNVTAVAVGTAKGSGYKIGDRVRINGALLGGGTAQDIVVTIASVTTTPAGPAGPNAQGDTPGAHINISFAEAAAACQVSNVELSLTRGEIEITSLPCGVKATESGVKLASFRTYQAGYAEGSGSMTVRFTGADDSVANRMIESSLFSAQGGARLKVYLNAVADSTGLKPDDTKSLLVDFPVTLLGFSFNLTSEDTPTEASIQFRLAGAPTRLLGLN